MASHQENAPFLLDALICEEEHWEKSDITENFANCLNLECFLQFLGQDLLWDDEELGSLLNKEQENELYAGLEGNPSLAKARREAVEWMLKVIGYYSFSALAAVLAVKYLHRFFFRFQSHIEKPWMTQLAVVACLSLAPKVEETQVPLL